MADERSEATDGVFLLPRLRARRGLEMGAAAIWLLSTLAAAGYDAEPLRAEAQAAVEAGSLKTARRLLKSELATLRLKAQDLPRVPQETVDETSAIYLRLGKDAVQGVAGIIFRPITLMPCSHLSTTCSSLLF